MVVHDLRWWEWDKKNRSIVEGDPASMTEVCWTSYNLVKHKTVYNTK